MKTLNLAEIYGAVDRENAAKQQRDFQNYQIQRQQKEDQRSDASRAAYVVNPDGSVDEQATMGNLYKADPQAANKFAIQQQELKAANQKALSEKTTADLNNKVATAKYLRDQLAGVTDQAGYEAALGEAKQLGAQFVQGAPAQYNPDWIRGHVMDADKFLTLNTPKYEKVDLGGQIKVVDTNPFTNPSIKGSQFDKTATIGEKESSRHNKATEGQAYSTLQETKRHNNVSEKNAEGGKAPSGYRFNPDGSLTAIAGGPGDKALNPTEGQGKAALYGSRALEADKILNNLDGSYSPAGINAKLGAENTPLIGGMIAPIANSALSPQSQQAEQAQRDFVNAILRQESGAAIGQSEFDNARKQYFRQPGDSQEVIAQKYANRQTAIKGLGTMAGAAGKDIVQGNILPKNSKISQPTLKKGKIEDGYVYQGGDPASQSSWKKAK